MAVVVVTTRVEGYFTFRLWSCWMRFGEHKTGVYVDTGFFHWLGQY
jgi:hypothetical protein